MLRFFLQVKIFRLMTSIGFYILMRIEDFSEIKNKN